MAKAKQPGSTGAGQGTQDEQTNPTPDAGVAVDVAPPPTVEQAEPAEAAPMSNQMEDPPPAALVKARVLVAGAYGQCNDVVEIDLEAARAQPDVLDTTPEAVAYAESLATAQ